MKTRRLLPLMLAFALGACASPDSTEVDADGSGGASGAGVAGSVDAAGNGGPGGGEGGAGGHPTTGGAGEIGSAGTTGNGGSGATDGKAGSTGSAGTTGNGGETGSGGTNGGGSAGRGGSLGSAGASGAAGTTGAAGVIGTAGRGGSGGVSGAGGGTCSVAPVSPDPSQQAKNLLCYLYGVYGNHVLSGQQETSWSNPAADISWYTSNGMKYPAILGGDFLYSDGGGPTSETTTTARAIAYWNAGGITMIRYHMGMPPNADSYANAMLSPSGSFFTDVITAGTAENSSFVSKLDYIAYQIGVMKTNDVPVLLALFHETQANGWFWWSKGTGPQFIALWEYAFKYLTTTKGLNNIVWLMPFSGSPGSAYFPGKTYVDIAGSDTYGTNQPFTSLYSSTRGVVGATMPAPLHETGLIPTPSAMFPTAAPWVLFNIWAGYESDGTHNSVSNIQSVYASPNLITRDEIPSLK
jgi:hypothetical protein